MSSRTRMSRNLVLAVGLVIVIGSVAYLRKTNKTVAEKGPEPAQPAAPAAVTPAAKPAEPAPQPRATGQIALPGSAVAMVTQTPTPQTVKPAVATPTATVNASPTATPTGSDASKVAAKAPTPAPAPAKVEPGVTPEAPASANPIADGKAMIDAGKFLEGRTLLNAALLSGRLAPADVQKAKELIALANETLIFSPRRFPADPFTGSHTVASGQLPAKIAAAHDVTWDFLGRINGIADARRLRAGQTIKTVKGPFHAVVSKSRYAMDVYLGSPGERGSVYVRSFAVGLGKNDSTPMGTWMVAPQSKLKNPKWWGTADEPAREADDPQNPLGEFWLGLVGTEGDAVGKEGFGIHGTIDPDSIGKQMSHGCIRLVHDNIARVYEMLIDGKSTVIVKE